MITEVEVKWSTVKPNEFKLLGHLNISILEYVNVKSKGYFEHLCVHLN